MALTLYGIANCDTVRKARKWLEAEGIAYAFHDFKKQGLKAETVYDWLSHQPLDIVLNRRGTSWRKIDPSVQKSLSEGNAASLVRSEPALMKRPIFDDGKNVESIWNII